jgi:hypothetical protein
MSAPQIKIKIDKTALKNALALSADDIKTGRFTLDRMPDGDAGKVLVGTDIGSNPTWATIVVCIDDTQVGTVEFVTG